jgi:hypothetical protein
MLWREVFLIFLILFAFSCGASINTENESPPPPQEIPTAKVDISGSVKALNRGEEENLSGAKIKLIVDFNRNGVFEGKHSEDGRYLSATLDGEFFIKEVEIPLQGAKAELIVEKDGYAPYYKVLELLPKTDVNVNVELSPLSKDITPVLRSRGIVVGNSEVSLDFTPLAVEEDTTLLNVSYKIFDLKEELNKVPGEFFVDGKPMEILSLISLELKNQIGEVVEFADEYSCPYTIKQKLSPEAVVKIRNRGDIDRSEEGCQVPIYTFSLESGGWSYFGEGTVVDALGRKVHCDELSETSNYYVQSCGKSIEGTTFYAVAYPLNEKLVNVCFSVENEEGEPLAGALFESFKEGFYTSARTDKDGIAQLKVPFKVAPTNCATTAEEASKEGLLFRYFESSSLSQSVSLELSSLETGSLKGCTCLFKVKVPSSTVDAVVVVRDGFGNPLPDREVCIKEKDFNFYACRKTNDDGMAVFKVVPDRIYIAFGAGLSSLTKRVTAVDRFFSLSLSNTPPKVELSLYPNPVKAGDNLYVLLYAYDPDGDEIRLKNFNCGGERVRVIEGEDFEGALFITGYCKLTDPGNYKVSALVGDAYESFVVEKDFSVVLGSSPPYIYGYNFFDESGKLVTKDSIKAGQSYKLVFYAFDPDGDPLVYRSNNPYCLFETDGVARCSFPTAGDYNLSFTIDDRKGNEVESSIALHVSNGETIKIVALNVEPSVVLAGSTFKVRGIVYAPESEKVSASLLVDGNLFVPPKTCDRVSKGYFECLFEEVSDFVDGEHTVSLKVESGSSTDTRSVNLFAGISNLPPKLLLPLPPKLEAEVGVPSTFTVKAIDPDGDELSYRWFINGVEVSSGKDHLEYTFDASGVYKVEVLVSDGNEVAYTSSEVTAVNLDAGRQLIVHLGAEGVYGVLYSDDYSYLDTEVSGELGAVYFGKLPTSGLNLAVVVPPEVIVPKDVVFEYLVSSVVKEACQVGDCGEVLNEAISWIATRRIPKEKLGSWSQKLRDENFDGFVDIEEVYKSFVLLYDTDKDGKVSFKEITGKTKVKTFVVRNVEGQQYFLNDVVKQFFEEMMPVPLQGKKRVSVK